MKNQSKLYLGMCVYGVGAGVGVCARTWETSGKTSQMMFQKP